MPDIPTPLPYRTNYAVDELLSQVDNTFATSFYQPFAGPASSFPGLSGLIKIGASDLHENRKWVGGVRLAGNLQNSTFVLSHQDLERKVDRQWIIERQGNERLNPDLDALTRTHTHAVHYRRTVPFSETMSLRAQLTYRLDRTALLATDPFNASRDDLYSQGIGGTLSWVFDDSRVRALNIRNGTRAKAWFEMLAPPDGDGDMLLVAGFDARRYIPLYQRVTLCLRAARLVLRRPAADPLPRRRAAVPHPLDRWRHAPPEREFAYQTAATPMQGFLRNARNGTSFAVANAELRLPIFATLMPKKTLTPLLEHFQAVGFFDIGSAWTGSDPYADENAFNSTTIEQYPVSITVDNNREPIIWDFGFGLQNRTPGLLRPRRLGLGRRRWADPRSRFPDFPDHRLLTHGRLCPSDLLLIGVSAGLLSGFIGIGGGLLIVPALMYFTGLSQMAAQGTSLALMLPPIGVPSP